MEAANTHAFMAGRRAAHASDDDDDDDEAELLSQVQAARLHRREAERHTGCKVAELAALAASLNAQGELWGRRPLAARRVFA